MKTLLKLCLASALVFGINACTKNNANGGGGNTCTSGLTCNVALEPGETAATVPNALLNTFSLTYDEINAGGAFQQGDMADFEFNNQNQMIVTFNGTCITVENPFQSSGSEITYRDNCLHQVRFAASETNNTINEVNIISLDGTQFFGQFK